MLYLIPMCLFIAFFIFVVVEVISREDDRDRADKLITGIREPKQKDIDKCIKALRTRNKMLFSRDETDRRRIELLRDMRNEMVTSTH